MEQKDVETNGELQRRGLRIEMSWTTRWGWQGGSKKSKVNKDIVNPLTCLDLVTAANKGSSILSILHSEFNPQTPR